MSFRSFFLHTPQDLDGREIVDRSEKLLWGKTFQGELEMSVATPRWQRTLTLRAWIERPRQSFIRILSPAKEAGIGSLRIGSEMWNYLPKVKRNVPRNKRRTLITAGGTYRPRLCIRQYAHARS